MSCCGGSCGCGGNCNCGNGCRGCKKFLDLSFGESTVAASLLASSASDVMMFKETETVAGENGGCGCGSGSVCKCGANCGCTACSCCK